ncbi:MAG: hypothetical protein ACKPKO_17855 [Candidatus Fonsibacter sp.]
MFIHSISPNASSLSFFDFIGHIAQYLLKNINTYHTYTIILVCQVSNERQINFIFIVGMRCNE